MMKFNNEYTQKLLAAEDIFFKMFEANGRRLRGDCSSYLYSHRTNLGMHFNFDTYRKQLLLYEVAKNATNVLEIGTYLAHSTLIMLLANPRLNIVTIDQHATYSIKPVGVLQKHFPDASIQFVCGKSLDVLPTQQGPFDFFHVDGSHDDDIVMQELQLCLSIRDQSRPTSFILDDFKGIPKSQEFLLSNFSRMSEKKALGQSPNWAITISN